MSVQGCLARSHARAQGLFAIVLSTGQTAFHAAPSRGKNTESKQERQREKGSKGERMKEE